MKCGINKWYLYCVLSGKTDSQSIYVLALGVVGKCSKHSVWNKKIYKGNYVPWCRGGYGYILSRKSALEVKDYKEKYDDEIYEDLLIAKILLKSDIQPTVLNEFHF